MLHEATGVSVSEATVCRVLKRHGLTRKKVRLVAQQRSLENEENLWQESCPFQEISLCLLMKQEVMLTTL